MIPRKRRVPVLGLRNSLHYYPLPIIGASEIAPRIVTFHKKIIAADLTRKRPRRPNDHVGPDRSGNSAVAGTSPRISFVAAPTSFR